MSECLESSVVFSRLESNWKARIKWPVLESSIRDENERSRVNFTGQTKLPFRWTGKVNSGGSTLKPSNLPKTVNFGLHQLQCQFFTWHWKFQFLYSYFSLTLNNIMIIQFFIFISFVLIYSFSQSIEDLKFLMF